MFECPSFCIVPGILQMSQPELALLVRFAGHTIQTARIT